MMALTICHGVGIIIPENILLWTMRFKGNNQRLFKTLVYITVCFLLLCGTGDGVEASSNVCGPELGKISIKYTWQKSSVSREQFQRELCTRTCSNGTIRNHDLSSCTKIRCFECMCERPKCQIYGTCCPSDPRYPSSATTTAVAGPVQQNGTQAPGKMDTPVLKCEASGTSSGYLYIQSCPRAYNDSQTRRLCEEEYKLEEKQNLTLDQFARVSDSELEVVYHNKYCALCNRALQPVQWKVKVDCDHFMAVYTATTFDQLLTLSLEPESFCKVKQIPVVKHLTPCNQDWFRGDPISKCNVTGFWRTYDADVERACLQLRRRSYNVYLDAHHSSLRPYANIFCAICNLENYPTCRKKICRGTTDTAAPNVAKAPISLSPASVDKSNFFASDDIQAQLAHAFSPLIEFGNGPNFVETALIKSLSQTAISSVPQLKPKTQPPLSFILGFRRKPRKSRPVYKSPFTYNACQDEEWSSPDGLCLKVHCTSGKVLHYGECITALDQIRGLGYRFDLWFAPGMNLANNLAAPTELSALNTTEAYLEDKLKSSLNESLDGYRLLTTMFVASDANKGSDGTVDDDDDDEDDEDDDDDDDDDDHDDDHDQDAEVDFPISVWTRLFLTASENVSRDDFEEELQEFAATFVQRKSADLTPNVQPEIVPIFPSGNVDPASLCTNSKATCHHANRLGYSKRSAIFKVQNSFLKWSHLLTCPYVQLNDSHYTVHQAETFDFVPKYKLTLTLGKAIMSFSETQELTQMFIDENNMLRICADILNIRLKQLEEDRLREFYNRTLESDESTVERAQYYLTLVCLSASIVCLVSTLVTYLIFKVLRNTAGMNNIFLCGSLLLAQASLLASSHVDGPKTLCTVLGMLTHFLWLWMFAWSFICCFHMFRVFTSTSRRNGTCCCRFLFILVLSVAGPVTVIVVVITSSLTLTSGHRIGYGYDACYLDTPLLVGLATVLPVCLVTVINIVFFAITMAKIYSIRKLQSTDALKSKDRQNFFIYIKLSTITGAFWLVLILAEALDVDVLRFIAIVTNGLQGVFIFLSYVCNKRVFNLYKERFEQKPTTLTSVDALARSRTGRGQPKQSSKTDMVSDNTESSTKTTMEMQASKEKQREQLKEKAHVSPAPRADDSQMDAMMAELSSSISKVAVSEDSGISAEAHSSAV